MTFLSRAFILLTCLVSLAGCEHWDSFKSWAMGGKSNPSRAAYNITPARESWCYRTLGRVECYPQPQNLPPESLVSVDPPHLLPLSREGHAKALAATQPLPPKAEEESPAPAPAARPTPLVQPAGK